MKKHLLILGDVRIGDCFHIGTYLNKMKGEYRTTWVHGDYEEKAVEFLRDHTDTGIELTIKKSTTCKDVPMDLNSIRGFIKAYRGDNETDRRGFDLITEDPGPIFFQKGDPVVFNCRNLSARPAREVFITTHLSSISSWKQHPFLFKMQFPLPIYGLGSKPEQINQYAIDYRDRDLGEVAGLMLRSRVFIGIHSSMTCLAFHLGVPLICCHFWGGENVLHFSDYRENCIDLLKPDYTTLMEAIEKMGIK